MATLDISSILSARRKSRQMTKLAFARLLVVLAVPFSLRYFYWASRFDHESRGPVQQFSSGAKADSSAITWCEPGFMMTMDNARPWPCNTVLRERTRMAVHLTASEESALFCFAFLSNELPRAEKY